MCGLAGMIGTNIWKKDREAYLDLLGISYLRGWHSTGIFTTSFRDKKPIERMAKRTISSPQFIVDDLNQSADKSVFKSMWADVYIGHCRSATVGEVNSKNAHPFDVGNLVGAHNGTLNDFWSFGNKGTEDEGKTDSQIMFERMEKMGVEEVLKDVSPSSAWAISVWDRKNRKLILGRNKERPLFVGFNEERGVMYWASERRFMDFVAERHELKLDIYYLTKNRIYIIDPNKVVKGNTTPWKCIEIPEKKYTSITSNYTSKAADNQSWGEGGAEYGGCWHRADVWDYCTGCDKILTAADIAHKDCTHVQVDNVDYYCCAECTTATRDEAKAESKQEQKEVKTSVPLVNHRGDLLKPENLN